MNTPRGNAAWRDFPSKLAKLYMELYKRVVHEIQSINQYLRLIGRIICTHPMLDVHKQIDIRIALNAPI